MQKEIKTVLSKDGISIEYDHLKNQHQDLIVIAHGFYNSKQSELLQRLGDRLLSTHDVIIMDFRGHGRSRGLFSWTTKEYMDLEAVLNEVRAQYNKICVIGFSLGAAISMHVAVRTDLIDNLIYVCGPAKLIRIDFQWWKLDVENDIIYNMGKGAIGKGVRPGVFWFSKPQPIKLVSKLKVPIFYIHSSADWVIRPWHSEKLYERTQVKKRLKIIQDGPHAEYLMRKNEQEFVQDIQTWLHDTMAD